MAKCRGIIVLLNMIKSGIMPIRLASMGYEPMLQKTILILTENRRLGSELKNLLIKGDIEVTWIRGMASAMKMNLENNFALIIVDIRDSLVDGLHLCQEIHGSCPTPILLLVNGGENFRIKGLDAGADKCMSKPVDVLELIANVRVIFRRTEPPDIRYQNEVKPIAINNLIIDPDKHVVTLDKKMIELTAKEFSLLHILAKNKGRILSRQTLIQQVWGDEPLESQRTIDVHICRLRKKIERNTIRPTRLISVRGFGYKLEK